jgi:hypothetical protein
MSEASTRDMVLDIGVTTESIQVTGHTSLGDYHGEVGTMCRSYVIEMPLSIAMYSTRQPGSRFVLERRPGFARRRPPADGAAPGGWRK